MVPRPRRFDERALLYIGLPAFLLILAIMLVIVVYAAIAPSMPTWGYYAGGIGIVAVLIVAALATIVAYIGAWFREAPR